MLSRREASPPFGKRPCPHSGTITAIEVQAKRKDRVNVYLDDRFAFALAAIVAEAAELRRGTFLPKERVAELLEKDSFQKSLDTALRFLSYRPRSEQEVRLNLQRKNVPETLSEQVIRRLKELGVLDDAAFAEFWRQNREAFSPRSARAIKSELRRKGVDSDVIAQAVDEAVDEVAAAYTAAQKKARLLHKLDYKSFYLRLGGYLSRRGFPYDVVKSTVDRCWRERE